MKFTKYINDIAKLIKINIGRINSRNFPENIRYTMSTENIFELTYEEYDLLEEIIEDISSANNYDDKFPKNFIFDKLVREVIIKSYDIDSNMSEIKSNLKNRFQEFENMLNEEIKDWTYFIPISGIYVENKINLKSMTIYPFESFKNEVLDYLNNNRFDNDKLYYQRTIDSINELKSFCFVKLTIRGTKDTSKDKALNKVNELLSIFSLYKPLDNNGFGIMGDVLPLNSELITYSFYENKLNTIHKRTVESRHFNLNENIDNMKNYHLDYLIELINKNELYEIEKRLFNSIQWYYESVKKECIYEEEIIEVTLKSNEYYEHRTYFKLGNRIINLVSSLESLLIFNNKTNLKTRQERFNLIMNYKTNKFYDYSEDLKEIYDIRHDIVHSNKLKNLLKFNISKNTYLVEMFIIKFIEIKLDFDKYSTKSLNTKEELNNFYNGKNRLKID